MINSQTSILSHLVPNTEEVEEKYIGYLLQSPNEAYLVPTSEYAKLDHRIIVEALIELQTNNLKIDFDSILLLCRKKNSNFNSDVLTKILNLPKNFDNIDLFKKEILEGSIKRKTLSQLENLLIKTTSKSFFDIEEFQSLLQKLLETSYSLGEKNLLDGKALKENYQKILDKRKQGIAKRSLGYDSLHKIIVRPAAPGEMTGIVGQKGGGKSTLVKNIEQRLTSQKICVVSVNLEMSQESNMDRFQCMKTGFPLSLVLAKEHSAREESQLNRALDSWSNIDNYLYFDEPSLTLNQLDGILYKAKQIFRSKGILPEDEYFLCVVDLITMVSEFGEADNPYKIEANANKLHTMVKKHKIHLIPILQANENKFRNGKMFKNPSDLDFYKVGLEDIKNSAVWAERCRVILTMTRPVQLKKRFFPEQNDLWNLETDVINAHVVKQNDGDEGLCRFVLNKNFRIYPFVENENEIEQD